ncbi:hypothetical protein AG1IA_08117 [Rhizoctonia solani AG-1 IA]|uniref:Uncharacterized protein n=1 Tax=Thanatephorus cucumeris (strain AG1-IA) TaxID=983506 RepID=L8WM76_THACA|nr:hypothetical protein AG1IA_08117 [Rhizoctonia solani AG-1 IA]
MKAVGTGPNLIIISFPLYLPNVEPPVNKIEEHLKVPALLAGVKEVIKSLPRQNQDKMEPGKGFTLCFSSNLNFFEASRASLMAWVTQDKVF